MTDHEKTLTGSARLSGTPAIQPLDTKGLHLQLAGSISWFIQCGRADGSYIDNLELSPAPEDDESAMASVLATLGAEWDAHVVGGWQDQSPARLKSDGGCVRAISIPVLLYPKSK
jgi:hypothetical protein